MVWLGGLTKLTILKCDQNRLVELNPALGNCISLQVRGDVIKNNKEIDYGRQKARKKICIFSLFY